MRFASEIIARHYEQAELQHPLTKQLTKLLQDHSRVQAYLAYEDNAVGAMISFETQTHLIAMLLVDKHSQLEKRLLEDALNQDKQACVIEECSADTVSVKEDTLERWSIPEQNLTGD